MIRSAASLTATLARLVIVVAGGTLLILLTSCSMCLAQQAASASIPEETLAEKISDPTANPTQITFQNLYAPAE